MYKNSPTSNSLALKKRDNPNIAQIMLYATKEFKNTDEDSRLFNKPSTCIAVKINSYNKQWVTAFFALTDINSTKQLNFLSKFPRRAAV